MFQTPLTGRRFPESVFLPQYANFRFLDAELIDSPALSGFVARLSSLAGTATLEPETSTDATLWWDSSQQWAIWAERAAQVAVFACTKKFDSLAAQAFRECGVCALNVDDALDLTAHLWPDRASKVQFANRLLSHYGAAETLSYLAMTAALDLLGGNIGVIEVSSLLHGVWTPSCPEIEHLLLVFVSLQHEAWCLPWGDSEAEIAQIEEFEESNREPAIQAVHQRIDHLVHSSLYTRSKHGAY